MITEMNGQAEVVTFNRRVLGLNGGEPVPVTRIGAFVAIADQGGPVFLNWSSDEAAARRPSRWSRLSASLRAR
jgi:biopolymer transport protein ExbB